MASRYANQSIKFLLSMACVALFLFPQSVHALQVAGVGNNFNSVVGGVTVDADSVVRGNHKELSEKIRQQINQALAKGDADVSKASDLRVISLKGLEKAIAESMDSGKPLSPEIQYLAGMQRVEYVMVTPENDDVLIAGPGEGWKTDNSGNVVGIKSGMPVVHLQDLLVAMRSVDNAKQSPGISVSINPTAEGSKRYNKIIGKVTAANLNKATISSLEQAMGPQDIVLTGVPRDSHYSRVLLASDYAMKRLAMGLEPSPLRKLPSIMETISRKKMRPNRAAPRMWMECNYEPVAKNEQGTAWHISGQGVRTQTEETKFDADGKQVGTGKKMIVAEQWAEKMTKHFEELSAQVPVFRDLRNAMDLAVISAIIQSEGLLTKVGLELPHIAGSLKTPTFEVPKTVPSELSYVTSRNSPVLQISGGVIINSWGVAQNDAVKKEMNGVEKVAMNNASDRWWWNAK